MDDALFFLLAALFFAAIPFVLPIVAWVSSRNTRLRVNTLEEIVRDQERTIDVLKVQVEQLRREMREAPPAAVPKPAEPVVPKPSEPATVKPTVPVEPKAPEPVVPKPVAPQPPEPRPAPPPPPAMPKPVVPPPAVTSPPVTPPAAERPRVSASPPPTPPPPPPAPPAPPEEPPSGGFLSGFDWESLAGAKLFPIASGVALALGAIYFLGYSIEQGWLQPPVRVMIGIAVAVSLLVVCELKAARNYPVIANALDAAAIAILFASFFSAHALWGLIPNWVAFGLLALVTALAVVLSIRRESLFIAVLGLLGGFSTPILLSRDENRPIALFSYLLLLNVGLAWVAYKKTWPILTVLTLIFTTLYQWGWVFKFLRDASDLSLAMGIFIVFPLVTFVGVVLSRKPSLDESADSSDSTFERTALVAAMIPVIFAMYLAAVPAYGARASLLFGFLLLVDAGLLAIAIARRQPIVHAVGALSTLLAVAVWLAVSYVHEARLVALAFVSIFVVLYLAAPVIAAWFRRPFEGASSAEYAAPLLLFAFAVLAAIEPAFASPSVLFGTLLVLTLLCAWRAAVSGAGFIYYIAGFFAIAAQAVWAVKYLTVERLGTAVAIFAVFGIVSIAAPLAARRSGRPFLPEGGGGLVLFASLFLLLYLASGPIAPAALWALALLLAILNAGLFVESAGARLPALSIAGSVLSWVILGIWWISAAGSVGVLSSLTVLIGLTLLTLAGHTWSASQSRAERPPSDTAMAGISLFSSGLFLGLVGHLFLFFLALNREWSLPPWPVFGALAVVSLATSAAALHSRMPMLHAAGACAAAVVIAGWTAVVTTQPWPLAGLAVGAAVSAYALLWMPVFRKAGDSRIAPAGAAAALLVGEVTAIFAGNTLARPPIAAIVAAHVANVSTLLVLAWTRQWRHFAMVVSVVAAVATFSWDGGDWTGQFALSAALYLVFVAYPLVLGHRVAGEREPFLAAIVASATFFVAGRDALISGGYESIIGVLPVVEALVLAVLVQQLLRLEAPGTRDLGRLAVVAGAALAFVTVAIPLQLDHQWITIGWALEGAALAWLFTRVPHRGLLYASVALLAAVFVRLALNPDVFLYEPRGELRIFNWYLYTYLIAAASMFAATWWFVRTDARLVGELTPSHLLPAAGVILLFYLLNIEIADYYATGPEITFRFGARVSQDLTYTIGWLVFGGLLLAAGIYLRTRPARIAAVALIALTAFKCFLYDLREFGGLYRVGSLVGLAIALALVSLALQKYVLARPKDAT